jgi:hypothetical protein
MESYHKMKRELMYLSDRQHKTADSSRKGTLESGRSENQSQQKKTTQWLNS